MNWYSIQVIAFVLLVILNFYLILTSVISIIAGILIWIFVLPILFTVIGFITFKLEEKGYIHKNE